LQHYGPHVASAVGVLSPAQAFVFLQVHAANALSMNYHPILHSLEASFLPTLLEKQTEVLSESPRDIALRVWHNKLPPYAHSQKERAEEFSLIWNRESLRACFLVDLKKLSHGRVLKG
jgi:hypothetical protein